MAGRLMGSELIWANSQSYSSSSGNGYEPGCGCKDEARKMDAGETTIEKTIEVMREEAEKRKLFEPCEIDSHLVAKARKKADIDFEHNARGLEFRWQSN